MANPHPPPPPGFDASPRASVASGRVATEGREGLLSQTPFSIHSPASPLGVNGEGAAAADAPIQPDRLRTLAETIRYFPETLNALLQEVSSTELPSAARKAAAQERCRQLREVIKQTSTAARLDWSCSVYPVVYALEAIIDEWNCEAPASTDSTNGADGATAGAAVEVEVPQGLVEMANMLTEVYSTGVTEFLQGADVESDEDDDDDNGNDDDDEDDDDDDDDDDHEAWVDAEIDGAAAAGGKEETPMLADGSDETAGTSSSPAASATTTSSDVSSGATNVQQEPHLVHADIGIAGQPSTDSYVDVSPPHVLADSAAAGTAAILSLLVRKDEVGIGVEPLFQLTKGWLKFSKEVTGYLEKRNAIEIEMHRKLSQLSRGTSGASDSLEFCSIWTPMLEEHCRWSQWFRENFLESVNANFVQPLVHLRLKQEKERKTLKDTWAKETKRVAESVTTVSRARSRYASVSAEWEKALLARERDREVVDRGGALDTRQQRGHHRRAKEETELRARVEDARQAYFAAVRQGNLLSADVDSYRRIVVTKLIAILFEGGAHLKQVLTSYFDLTRRTFLPRPEDMDALREVAQQDDAQRTLKKVLLNTMKAAGGTVNGTEQHVFEPYRLGAEALVCLQSAGEINQCVAAVEQQVTVRGTSRAAGNGRGGSPNRKPSRFKDRVSGVIGTALDEQPRDPVTGVPRVVVVLATAVEKRLDEEGLYRKPGVKSHIQRLCEELPSHLRGGSTDAAAGARLVGYDTHVLASTLKMYLRQLPSALVPAELTSEALAVAQSLRDRAGPYTQDEACALLKPIIERMPEVNRATLGFMVGHLRRVAAEAAVNKMKPSALAIVFGPTLLRRDTEDQLAALGDMPLQVATVEMLVASADSLFPSIVLAAPTVVDPGTERDSTLLAPPL